MKSPTAKKNLALDRKCIAIRIKFFIWYPWDAN